MLSTGDFMTLLALLNELCVNVVDKRIVAFIRVFDNPVCPSVRRAETVSRMKDTAYYCEFHRLGIGARVRDRDV